MQGKLIVFEGPDGVGKSDLVDRFCGALKRQRVNVVSFAFPGKDDGTLGKLVYDVHHRPDEFGIKELTAASLQLLHIAAHIDAIESRILPLLREGVTAVLDRFWWSTLVYGLVSKIDAGLLKGMIEVERQAWGSTTPTMVFMIDRSQPLRAEPPCWPEWRNAYFDLLSRERAHYPCLVVENERQIEQTEEVLLHTWDQIQQP